MTASVAAVPVVVSPVVASSTTPAVDVSAAVCAPVCAWPTKIPSIAVTGIFVTLFAIIYGHFFESRFMVCDEVVPEGKDTYFYKSPEGPSR